MSLFSIVITVLVSGFVGCVYKAVDNHEGERKVTGKKIEEVLKEHTERLMAIPGVIGTAQGISNNKPCINVYVIEKTTELREKIPDSIEGYGVVIVAAGEIKALEE